MTPKDEFWIRLEGRSRIRPGGEADGVRWTAAGPVRYALQPGWSTLLPDRMVARGIGMADVMIRLIPMRRAEEILWLFWWPDRTPGGRIVQRLAAAFAPRSVALYPEATRFETDESGVDWKAPKARTAYQHLLGVRPRK